MFLFVLFVFIVRIAFIVRFVREYRLRPLESASKASLRAQLSRLVSRAHLRTIYYTYV